MTWRDACSVLTKSELRAIAKARGLRWYSYLVKSELAFRLFSRDAVFNRALCCANQLRRYNIPEPNEAKQWSQ